MCPCGCLPAALKPRRVRACCPRALPARAVPTTADPGRSCASRTRRAYAVVIAPCALHVRRHRQTLIPIRRRIYATAIGGTLRMSDWMLVSRLDADHVKGLQHAKQIGPVCPRHLHRYHNATSRFGEINYRCAATCICICLGCMRYIRA